MTKPSFLWQDFPRHPANDRQPRTTSRHPMKPKGSAVPDTRSQLEVLLETHLPDTKVRFADKELDVVLPKMATSPSTWTPNMVAEAAVGVLGKSHRVTSPRLIGEALDWLVERGVLAREGKSSYRISRESGHPVGQRILSVLPVYF